MFKSSISHALRKVPEIDSEESSSHSPPLLERSDLPVIQSAGQPELMDDVRDAGAKGTLIRDLTIRTANGGLRELVETSLTSAPTEEARRDIETSTSKSNQSFPFKRLPAEIRLLIYRFILYSGRDATGCEEVEIRLRRTLNSEGVRFIHLTSIWPQSILSHPFDEGPKFTGEASQLPEYTSSVRPNVRFLRTCHMVYQEAMPVLYGENCFQFPQCYVSALRSVGHSVRDWHLAHHAVNKFLMEIGPQGRANLRKLSIPLLNYANRRIPRIIKRHDLWQFSLSIVATRKEPWHWQAGRQAGNFAPLEDYACQNNIVSLRGCVDISFPQPDAKKSRATFGREAEELFHDNDPLADHIRSRIKERSIGWLPPRITTP